MTVAVSVFPAVPVASRWLDPALLAGQLASEAASLARWRTAMAQDTRLSPYTINRRLAAVKRLVAEAASQGYADRAAAEAFRQVAGVQAKTLKDRMKTLTRTRLTPGQMRELCEAPDRLTLRGWRDRALLHTLASRGFVV
jgi:site-specific recombinase XerD